MSDMLNLSGAARLLGVSHPTVRKLIADGQIPALRIADRVVRICKTDVENYLADCRARSTVESRRAA